MKNSKSHYLILQTVDYSWEIWLLKAFLNIFVTFFSWFNKLLSFSPPLLTKNFLAMVSHDQANLIKIHYGILQHFKDSPLSYYIWDGKAYFDGNKAKEWISKRMFQENKARQIFWKKNLSYPMIRTPCAYQWVRNVRFSENLVFCILETSVSRFALLLYYRQIATEKMQSLKNEMLQTCCTPALKFSLKKSIGHL